MHRDDPAWPNRADPPTEPMTPQPPLAQAGTVPTVPAHALDTADSSIPVVAVRDLTKTYLLGQTPVHALRGLTVNIYPREFVAIMGPSGSGKSTFMNLVGCLDRPTSGECWLAGEPVSRMSADQLADVRARRIGFVFQGFNLLPRATALANVALPMLYAGFAPAQREARARRALELVGLGSRLNHKPAQLSGGQQQRVAIARALVNSPALLLADEPTGNLDSRTSIEILAVLQALNARGLTVVLVTHEPDIAAFAQRQISFRDGKIIRDTPVAAPRSARAEWSRRAQEAQPAQQQAATAVDGAGGRRVPVNEDRT